MEIPYNRKRKKNGKLPGCFARKPPNLERLLSAIRKEKDAVSWEEIRAIWILESLSAKDLRDVTLDVLNDHLLTNISDWEKIETDLFKRMYLNPPRIANEMLTPYKKVLR